MAGNTITSFFVALCLVCLGITATRLLDFLTESSKCYREATRVEDNGCATIKDCIRRAKFIEEDAKRSSHKALRLILFSAVLSVAGMKVGGYISATGQTPSSGGFMMASVNVSGTISRTVAGCATTCLLPSRCTTILPCHSSSFTLFQS